MPDGEVIREIVQVNADDLQALRKTASTHDVEVHEMPQRGFDPATTIVLLLVGSAIAVASVTHALEARKGGQIIDLRPGASQPIRRSRDLLYGLIVIFTADGKVSIKTHETKGTFDLISEKLVSALPRLVGAKSDDIQRTISEEISSGSAIVSITQGPSDDE